MILRAFLRRKIKISILKKSTFYQFLLLKSYTYSVRCEMYVEGPMFLLDPED